MQVAKEVAIVVVQNNNCTLIYNMHFIDTITQLSPIHSCVDIPTL